MTSATRSEPSLKSLRWWISVTTPRPLARPRLANARKIAGTPVSRSVKYASSLIKIFAPGIEDHRAAIQALATAIMKPRASEPSVRAEVSKTISGLERSSGLPCSSLVWPDTRPDKSPSMNRNKPSATGSPHLAKSSTVATDSPSVGPGTASGLGLYSASTTSAKTATRP